MELPLLGFVFVVCLIFFLVKLVYTSSHPAKRLPPGPWKLPLLGSLHHVLLSRHGDLLHRAMRDLSQGHGPLVLHPFGSVPTLVVSSAEVAREFLQTHDAAFASRHLTPTLAILSRNGEDILFSPYGDLWRQLRRVCVTELLSPRRVMSFRQIREDEVASLLRAVGSSGATVQIGDLMSRTLNDIVVRSAMGGRCPRRDEFLHELEESVKLAAGFNFADLYPSSKLARWLSGGLREAERRNGNVRSIMEDIIRDRERAGGGGESDEDLLGVLLRLQKDGGVLTTELIITVIMEILGAGSETSSTTLEWAMAELMRNPDAMLKAQAEVRDAFQGQSRLTEGDLLGRLSYLELVIRETLRLHAPLPFLLPRQSPEPCEVMGYHIPGGTRVLVNAWALGRDATYWGENAEAFRPERFKETSVDFHGGHLEYIPFGAGRRICPGVALGLANMELLLASLLYHFDWELPAGEELDMAEVFGIAIRKKSKLVMRATQRIPFLA